ncbi:hypothetical protein EXIGLDRAFT_779060 [Exidia glandulosa HHB12029]|uniref:Uncharacterized protein n=1 Tax=Exidia glandulosa HHB12029 TaxID=1314781 RepID=A0A165C8H9_EXIGL|nr:hypothetical protein EXIGLDRAFT_779060 [Exidia glandulosa HHB12029]
MDVDHRRLIEAPMARTNPRRPSGAVKHDKILAAACRIGGGRRERDSIGETVNKTVRAPTVQASPRVTQADGLLSNSMQPREDSFKRLRHESNTAKAMRIRAKGRRTRPSHRQSTSRLLHSHALMDSFNNDQPQPEIDRDTPNGFNLTCIIA